ncbi:MAG: hypothetical protein U9N40_04060 [Euryarchaeota archaeon]|nr:hypothetical protein [Euryarchaeota archaeon]
MKKVDGFLSDSVTSIYHLGLVAGVYDSLEIGAIVEQCIGLDIYKNNGNSERKKY